ncbi:hypothetical protein QBC43DRAFT_360685 [Cladorrhinum sp. PSN259]|nr:hypothetical protein QBC43DRAFT_360685 [Cladorrhinum sp. PSN259]
METMDSNTTCSSAKPDVPFIPFLAGLTIWAVLKLTLEGFIRNFFPTFYEDLRLDIRRKYNFYFGTWMGSIFKVVSMISCGAALFTTTAETDIVGLVRPLNVAEQWCWGCRAVIYIQELPDITSVPELIIHHVLSIAAMMGILAYNLPRRQLYLLWATLVNEFVGNARRILKIHDRLSPRVSWWTALANSSLIWIFRISGAFVALIWALQGGTRGISLFINITAMLVYIIYMIKMTAFEFSRNKIFNIDPVEHSHLVIVEKWKVNLVGIFMGLGLACTELSAMLIYELGDGRVSSEGGLHTIAFVALQAAVVGLAGAYLFPRVSKDTEKNLPKLSLHGGFLFAAATILFSPTLADNVDRAAFAACLMLSFPLMESITRYGRSLSSPTFIVSQIPASEKNALNLMDANDKSSKAQPTVVPIVTVALTKPGPSLQRIASCFSAAIYFSVLTAYYIGSVTLYQATGLALAMQAAVHLNIEVRRDGLFSSSSLLQKGRIWAMMFHSSQAGICMLCVAYIAYFENRHFDSHDRDYYASIQFWLKYHLLFFAVLFGTDHTIDFLSRRMRRSKKPRVECLSPSGEKGTVVAGPYGKAVVVKNPRPKSSVSGLKGISILCGVGLCLLIAAGEYLDIMPTQVTSVDEAITSGRLIPESALWGAASSWQFAVSVLGVTVLPVFVVQLMG